MPPNWVGHPQCVLFEGGTVGCALSWVIWCIGVFVSLFNYYYVRHIDKKTTKVRQEFLQASHSSLDEEKKSENGQPDVGGKIVKK